MRDVDQVAEAHRLQRERGYGGRRVARELGITRELAAQLLAEPDPTRQDPRVAAVAQAIISTVPGAIETSTMVTIACRWTRYGRQGTDSWTGRPERLAERIVEALDALGEGSGEPRLTVTAAAARYAEELRRTPGQASADGHAGWECDAGASLLVSAETPGPGKLGTHHGVIYACAEHRAAAEERIEGAGYESQTDPAPAGQQRDPWPCGHVTVYTAAALEALGRNAERAAEVPDAAAGVAR